MNKGFSVELCGDLDFEGMVVDISYEKQPIVSINYDKGVNNIEIRMFSMKAVTFSLNDFISVLENANKLAIKCAKEDGLK